MSVCPPPESPVTHRTGCDNGRVVDAQVDTTDTGLTSFRRFTWWSLTGTVVVLLVVGVGAWVLDREESATARTAGGTALAVTVVSCAVLLSRRLAHAPGAPPATPPVRLPMAWLVTGSAGAVVLGGTLLAVGNYRLWAYAPGTIVAVAATFLPNPHRRVLVVGAVAGTAVIGSVVGAASGDRLVDASVRPAGLVAFLAWVTLGTLWSWDVAERLNAARRLTAELAVKDERLRFAADLHDIQGHHLQVIALKSELAARLAEADAARASVEMKDVQRLATDALAETRAVVHGYRRTTLDDEIANATRILAAADIDARMDLDPGAGGAGAHPLPEDGRHLLGLVMREATTNVLRHSRARHAEVELRVTDGVARLRVGNDGADGQRPASAGSGLPTLAERLQAAGGRLTWEHEGDRFVVTASLPLRDRPEAA